MVFGNVEEDERRLAKVSHAAFRRPKLASHPGCHETGQ